MAHFIPRNMINDATLVAELYFKEVMRLHGIPRSIISDCDTKLVCIHLGKERFPCKGKSKFMIRADGPFEILKRVNDNAYKVN